MEDNHILEATWGRAIKVWWAYLWRNILAVIVAFIVSFVVGAIFGFALGMMGVSNHSVLRGIGGLIGFSIGLGFSVIPMKMILNKQFGEFRLVLLKNETTNNESQVASN